MRHRSGFYILSAFLFIVSTAGFAQDFTADAFNLRSGRENDVARIFVSGDKVRIEPTQQQGSPGTFVIWDTGGHHYFVVMPERRMYMDVASPMVQQQALAFWRPADVDNACPDWEKLAAQLKTKERLGSCRKIGSDTVNGRSAVKYEGSSSDGKTGNLWLDTKLKLLVKMVDADGGVMEFRNIHEAALAGNLFEVPAGYQKLDLGGMNRRKPSD